jgi:hypothetical protein
MKCLCMTLNVGVWCVVSAVKIKEETSYFYGVWWVLTSFCREIREEEKCTVTSCRKECALAHTSNLLMTHTLWLPKVPNVNPCHYYVRGTVKYTVCINLPQSLQNLKHNIQKEIGNISKLPPLSVTQHFRKEKACLKPGNRQFKAVL